MPWSERQVFSITPVIAGAGRTGAMIGVGIGLIALAIGIGSGWSWFFRIGCRVKGHSSQWVSYWIY